MGNLPSQNLTLSQSFSLASFEKNNSYEKEVHDSRFGLIKIFRNNAKPDSHVMVLTKSSLDGDFENFGREVEIRSQLHHENLCRILGYNQDHMQKLCGASSTITIYAEYEKNNLEKELQKKINTKVFFSFFNNIFK